MLIARQSTARTVTVGPVLDADGVAVTGGVVGDFKIAVNGAAPAALNGSATATHRHTGFYSLALTATDLATVGTAEITIDDTVNAMPMKEISVIEEAIYDAYYAASATGLLPANVTQWLGQAAAAVTNNGVPEVDITHIGGVAVSASTAQLGVNLVNIAGAAVSTSTAQLGVNVVNFGGSAGTFASGIPAVNATQISGDSTAADNLEAAFDATVGAHEPFGIVDRGTAQSVGANDIVLRAAAAFVDDALNGATVVITNGTQVGSRAIITDYVGATDTATLGGGWTGATPTGTPTYTIYGSAQGSSLADIATAILDADASGSTTNSTLGAIINDWENGGRLDLLLDDTATASEVTAAAANVSVDEIQATALADLFNTDSATTYGAAVAGSVVKEIADNAGGSALTTDAIAEAMFTYDATATYGTANAGSVVKQIADNAGGSALTVQEIVDGVWDEDATGHQTQGTFGQAIGDPAADANTIFGAVVTGAAGATVAADIIAVKAETAAIVADTNELQTDWANGGRLDVILDARASQTSVDDLPTNAELTTALGTADDANLAAIAAVDAKIDTIDNFLDLEVAAILAAVDTEVAAVKAKTDSLTFTVANELDANVQSINGTAVTGNGGGTPWGPA
jgi:hypothetical protein